MLKRLYDCLLILNQHGFLTDTERIRAVKRIHKILERDEAFDKKQKARRR